MTEPLIEIPTDDDAPPDPWERVEDQNDPEVQTTVDVEEEEVPDPFEPVEDSALDDVPLPSVETEEVSNPWDNLTTEEVVSPLPPRVHRSLPPSPPVARLLSAPEEETPPADTTARPKPIPWRTAAEVRNPPLGKLLCEADPRLPRSRLLVAAWEWLPEGEDCVRFRLADDGEDVIVRVPETGHPTLTASVKVNSEEFDARLDLVVDRDARGLILGRDVLAGRFLVDPTCDEGWG